MWARSSPARTFDAEDSTVDANMVRDVGKRQRSQGSEEQGSVFDDNHHERVEDEKKRKNKFDELLVDLLEVMRP